MVAATDRLSPISKGQKGSILCASVVGDPRGGIDTDMAGTPGDGTDTAGGKSTPLRVEVSPSRQVATRDQRSEPHSTVASRLKWPCCDDCVG